LPVRFGEAVYGDIAAHFGWAGLNWILIHRFVSSLILIPFVFWAAWTAKKRMPSGDRVTRNPK
jgi:hypothetical protein